MFEVPVPPEGTQYEVEMLDGSSILGRVTLLLIFLIGSTHPCCTNDDLIIKDA